MKPLLVTATEESIGKTAVALALARLARERGRSVGYLKPKGTRLESTAGKTFDTDPALAADLLELGVDPADLEPVVYSPTFVDQVLKGREDPADLAERVRRAFEAQAADHEFVVVEGDMGTGGVVGLTDPEVADMLDADVLLVAGYDGPRDVDAIVDAADRVGDRLAGVVFNGVADAEYDYVENTVVPFLEGRGVPVVGVVPRATDLAGVSVETLADELGAEVLTDVPTDGVVERFVVGAMGGDTALRYFRRTKDAAVITGGDRSDIHVAALEAAGVRCLVLTGGVRPSGSVLGTAEENGVPVLLVQTDTLGAVERAETVLRSGRTRSARTVDRMSGLLSEHADVEALLAGDSSADG
ncbi:phosphotransacetylase family protein [Candidatus Halobonum tyrrellensis]|uniref:Phosphotransacetylase BioD-like protein n=1 Tax=Candidatus Halobonum tyrrellensis G22 TaxID=1324957 RepID=V4HPW0_9EURY|nr:phosphotransacetylase family protein [Candidatus Halobonum tyrrellensis]ESP89949.1 phosphotransacetylase BioD-like protein [Candidatus Halobonum tyrrellensis G22]